jgi:hypothetical protein
MYQYTSSLSRREETIKYIKPETPLHDRIIEIWKNLHITSIPLRIKIATECVIFSYENAKEKVPCDAEYIRSVIDEIEGFNEPPKKACMTCF